MKFEAGLLEELLFLDSPQEHFVGAPAAQTAAGAAAAAPAVPAAAPLGAGASNGAPGGSGSLVLTAGAAIESVYEGVRVVHRGTLRVSFSMQLKVESWEFCAQSHEQASIMQEAHAHARHRVRRSGVVRLTRPALSRAQLFPRSALAAPLAALRQITTRGEVRPSRRRSMIALEMPSLTTEFTLRPLLLCRAPRAS